MRMLTRGAPPTPTKTATEPTIVTTGPHTPTPARAVSPISGMLPMYIRSTMLYSTLTNCPSMLGMAMRHTRRLTLSFPKSFSIATIPHPLAFFGKPFLYYSFSRRKGRAFPRNFWQAAFPLPPRTRPLQKIEKLSHFLFENPSPTCYNARDSSLTCGRPLGRQRGGCSHSNTP